MRPRTKRRLAVYIRRLFEYIVHGHVLSVPERRLHESQRVRAFANNR